LQRLEVELFGGDARLIALAPRHRKLSTQTKPPQRNFDAVRKSGASPVANLRNFGHRPAKFWKSSPIRVWHAKCTNRGSASASAGHRRYG
jgi:hypothetical protein